MLVVQHIWSHWTKKARAADEQRPRPPEACSLPNLLPDAAAWLHDVRRLEREDFRLEAQSLPLTVESWTHASPIHPANLSWRPRSTGYEISLHDPWSSMRRTAWPAQLPQPITTLEPGQVALIDWNGRFMNSLFGSNRGYFYAEHRFWLANAEAPGPRLFLDAQPRKHIDLRTKIY